MKKVVLTLTIALQVASICAQSIEKMIPFGDMNSWVTRKIEESNIIGGKEKTLYEIAPKREIIGREPYINEGGSPWATSNVMAKVAGITKTSASVFPDDGINSKAAYLKTRIETVKVLGIVNISVIAAGSIYLGSMIEPITSTSNPQAMLNSGIKFTERPEAVRYDYKISLSGKPTRMRITGFSPKKEVQGMDMPTMVLILQKRWEDADGTLHATRVGTAIVNYTENSDWVEDATYPIIYGDARESADYTPFMNVGYEQRYALNSRGENVPLLETTWAAADETPTHLILQFASSHGGAYVGSPENKMWVDNVRLVY